MRTGTHVPSRKVPMQNHNDQKSFLKKRSVLFSVLIIFIICVSWFFYQTYHNLFTSINNTKQPIYITVEPGTSFVKLAWELKRQGLIQNPRYVIAVARIQGHINKIKAGEYELKSGMSAWRLLRHMTLGEVYYHRFTIVEGWTFKQLMNYVNNYPYLEHTLSGLTDDQVMTAIGHPGLNPEGMFYPDTYLFSNRISDARILELAFDTMQRKLNQAWQNRAANVPYEDQYQALIVASLIEKETAKNSEKSQIAAVILRRLQQNMLLQIDPTVIYGLGDSFDGRLSRDDLTKDTPYNTYVHKGLPPTPIGMPSLTSIQAALNPAGNSENIYYVAKGDGGHVFSKTFTEHKAAIVQYLLPRKLASKAKQLIFAGVGRNICISSNLLLASWSNYGLSR